MENLQDTNTQFGPMQTVKRRMYAMRNGVIADTMRKAGSPFKIIFGLNLPQITEIANEIGVNDDLACDLWSNSTTRESMLLAPMLVNPDSFDYDTALRWTKEVTTLEVADILCHKLLRKVPYALSLAQYLYGQNDEMQRYLGLRLMRNIANKYPKEAYTMGVEELAKQCPSTRIIASQLTEY